METKKKLDWKRGLSVEDLTAIARQDADEFEGKTWEVD